MKLKNTIIAAVFAAATMAFAGAPAQAAGPMGGFQKNVTVDSSNIHDVRRSSRCFWRDGRRHCSRRSYRGSRYYGGGPGISLRFGFGPRYNRYNRYSDRGYRRGYYRR